MEENSKVWIFPFHYLLKILLCWWGLYPAQQIPGTAPPPTVQGLSPLPICPPVAHMASQHTHHYPAGFPCTSSCQPGTGPSSYGLSGFNTEEAGAYGSVSGQGRPGTRHSGPYIRYSLSPSPGYRPDILSKKQPASI